MASPNPKHDATYLAVNEAPHLQPIVTTLCCLATVFTGLRFWARRVKGVALGFDDWVLLAGLIMTWTSAGIIYRMISHGMGRHTEALPFDMVVAHGKDMYALECAYTTSITIIKTSVLLMYLRIFPSQNFRIACFVIEAIVIGWWISIVCASLFQCTPIEKAWLGASVAGHCVNMRASFIGNSIPNMTTDVVMLAMPIAQVWKLQVNAAQKLSVCVMFATGGFVLFASVYRFITILPFDQNDPTYAIAGPGVWSVTEAACGIISACLPTLRPVMAKLSHRLFGTSNEKTTSGGFSNQLRTDLVTIGGTTAKVQTGSKAGSKPWNSIFYRLEEGDEYPLNDGIRIQKTAYVSGRDVERGAHCDRDSEWSA